MWKNPENLTDKQKRTLAVIQPTNRPLYRAYLLKEQFREVIAVKGADGRLLLHGWLRWAGRSKLAPFVKLATDDPPAPARDPQHARQRTVQRPHRGQQRPPARTDPPGLRLPQRQALITMANLRRGGLCPPLPGR